MTGSTDPRDSLKINISPEEALKIGKLLGSQHRTVAVCRDGHRTSQMVEKAIMAGIISTGGDAYLAGECPATAMPFMRPRCDCYVCIAADDPEQISGINIHNPDGSYFDESQVFNLMSKEVRIHYPDYSGLGNATDAGGIIREYELALTELIKKCDCQIVMDGTYVSPTSVSAKVFTSMGSDVVIVNRSGNTSIQSLTELDLRDLTSTMGAYKGSIGMALNSDGSRFAAFDEERNHIDGRKLATIFAKELSPSRVTVPIDMTLAVDDVLDNDGVVVRVRRNIKSVVDMMRDNGSSLGMDLDGRFVFSDFSMTPDGIAAALRLGEIATTVKLCDLIDEIPDYPTCSEIIRTTVPEAELTEMIMEELSATEYTSMINVDGIRLDFDNGWFLVDVNGQDQCVTITCEARDKAYMVGLMEIAKNTVNAAIKRFD